MLRRDCKKITTESTTIKMGLWVGKGNLLCSCREGLSIWCTPCIGWMTVLV